MNKQSEYEEYFRELVEALELKLSNVDKYVENAISMGLKQFWGAKPWSFKQRQAILTIGTASDSYDLPADFDSMISIREESSIQGFRIEHVNKEMFDQLVPRQSFPADNNFSLIYTVFTIEDEDAKTNSKKVISIHPRPSSTSIPILYNKTTPDNLSEIPDKFQSGLEAFVAAHIFLPGFDQRIKAYNEARVETNRLEVQDNLDRSDLERHLIETSDGDRKTPRWWNF